MPIKLKALFAFLGLMIFPLTATAQAEYVFAGYAIVTSVTAGAVLTTGGIAGGITTTYHQKKIRPKQVLRFLKQNENEFRASRQLGSGAVLDDFTRLLGFEDKRSKELGQLLRRNRAHVDVTVGKLTEENVERLMLWIQVEMS